MTTPTPHPHSVVKCAGNIIDAGTHEGMRLLALKLNAQYQTDVYRVEPWDAARVLA